MYHRLRAAASKFVAYLHRSANTPIGAFATMALWDFLSTVFTRYAAQGSLLAVPANIALTAFWLVAVALVVTNRRPAIIGAMFVGVAVGTFFGLRV